jgi:hypothetical protein
MSPQFTKRYRNGIYSRSEVSDVWTWGDYINQQMLEVRLKRKYGQPVSDMQAKNYRKSIFLNQKLLCQSC